jgi:hypothetical protein
MKHIDGHPVNLRYEPAKSLSSAARFMDIEDYRTFINGYYKPPDASKYMPQKIRITYEEVTENDEN